MQKNIRVALCGDVLISRRLPNTYPRQLKEISKLFHKQDCCFGNLETTIHRREGYPEMFPGGSYTMADPFCLKDLQSFGFNVFNTANNHSMDYSHGGLMATIRHLDELGLPHCGTGRNLSEAAQPAFVECENGRVAFIGVTSSFHDSCAAGPQNQDIQGRPGVAPLRHNAIYNLDEQNFEDLVRIASLTGVNSYHDQARKEGYLPKSRDFKFGSFTFRKGSKNRVETSPIEADLLRTTMAIEDACYYSDLVIVSIHSHQFKGRDKHSTPDFIRIFAQKCIDAGAGIIVCHGPHVMRGVEVYKKGVIFHGLGNFILQHETMSVVPEEQYWKADTTRQQSSGVGGVLNARNRGGKIGLSADPQSWYSYFVMLDYTDNQYDFTLHPIEINKHLNNGLPALSNNASILDEIVELSNEWDTKFKVDKEKNTLLLQIRA